MRRMLARVRIARVAIEGGWPAPPFPSGAPVAGSERVFPIVLRSSPTVKSGPRAATTTARTASSEETSAMATGNSSKKADAIALRASVRSSHTVAT